MSAAPQIVLARHGQTDSKRLRIFLGQGDLPLNAEGRRQAHLLAVAMGDRGFARLFTSPLLRAVETADIVASAVGLVPIVDERLAETDVGRWQGRSRALVKAREPELYRSLRRRPAGFRFPRGEALAEHQQRVLSALDDIERGPLPALVICHQGTIRCVLTHRDPRGLAAWRTFKIPNGTTTIVAAQPQADVAAS
jgi:broad specificity phosphatase PhoE